VPTIASVNAPPDNRSGFGRLLEHWRSLRGLSQLALAEEVGTTTRHLSYLENGRSRPGRELVLRIAEALHLPLRSRNELLVAAGLPGEFSERAIGSTVLEPYRRALLSVMERLNPFPAFAVDAVFNLHELNWAARSMLTEVGGKPEATRSTTAAPLNLVDAFLAPGPGRARIANFPEVAWSWHSRLLRATPSRAAESQALRELRERVRSYLRDVPQPRFAGEGDPVMCPTFRVGDQLIRTIGMTLRFGPSRDVTLEELSVDLLHPRDTEAEAFFRSMAAS
jgi:transcriptional regulator with XRE-family HTH domain